MADKYINSYYNGNNGNKIYLELHVYTIATSVANNTTTERADLYAVVQDASYGWWNSYGSEVFIGINGNNTTRTVNFDYRSTGVKNLISSWDTVVNHDSNGKATIGISAHHYSGIGLGNASVSGTYTCDTIPRYATANQSLNSATETTITMNWSSDNVIDYVWYNVNNSDIWAGVDVPDGTSGTYTIYNLNPNTGYNIRTRVRRKDSQLTTDSNTMSVKTYSYPTQKFVNKTENNITMSWTADSTVSEVYFSVNNGSTWSSKISADATSGTYNIMNLSANTTYNVKTRIKRKGTQFYSDTSAITVKTYSYPTQTINNVTETSVNVSWTADNTIDLIYYSTNNGSTWSEAISVNATNGNYTINNLTPNTSYNIRTRFRRKDTQSYSNSSSSSIKTYYFPHCVGSPNFTIGDSVRLDFYNPLNREIEIELIGNNNSTIGYWKGTGTSINGFNDDWSKNAQYNSIPNSQSGYYKVQVKYGDHIEIRDLGNTYTINRNECVPNFSSFDIKDINSNTLNLTGNNQIIIKKYSNLQIDIPVAKKAVAKNGASIVRYVAVSGNKTIGINYSDTSLVSGVINNIENIDVVVYAVDSRGLSSQLVQKVFNFRDYNDIIITDSNVYRENGVGTKVLFELSGEYWNGNFGATDNKLAAVYYRMKKKKEENYGPYILITNQFTYEEGKYNNIENAFLPTTDNGTTSVEFEVGVEYNIQFIVRDMTYNFVSVYSNHLILNSGIPCTSKQKNNDGTYSVGINRLPNKEYALSVDGGLEIDGEGHTNGIVVSKDEPTRNESIWLQKSKNLIHPIENNSFTHLGIQVSTSKEKIHFKGTATEGAFLYIPINNIELDGTYTLSINPVGTVSMNQMSMSLTDINDNKIYEETSFQAGTIASLVFTEKITTGKLFFYCNAGVTVDFDAYIQLEPGRTATAYEEYVEKKINIKSHTGEYHEFLNIDKLKSTTKKSTLLTKYEYSTSDVLVGGSSQYTNIFQTDFISYGGPLQIVFTSSICNITYNYWLRVYLEIDGVVVGDFIDTYSTSTDSKTGILTAKISAGRHIAKIMVWNNNGPYEFKRIPAFTNSNFTIIEY